jgi:hypothetical protein
MVTDRERPQTANEFPKRILGVVAPGDAVTEAMRLI